MTVTSMIAPLACHGVILLIIIISLPINFLALNPMSPLTIESSQFLSLRKIATIQEGAFVGSTFVVSHLNARSSNEEKRTLTAGHKVNVADRIFIY